MPYFLSHKAIDAFEGNFGGTVRPGYRGVWRETSFRTKPPQGIGTKEVPLATAEPWTWHESYEALKARNYQRQNPSAQFARDRGHYWSSEKYSAEGVPLAGTFREQYGSRIYNWPYVVYPSFSQGLVPSMSEWHTLSDPAELVSYGALAYTQASPLSEEFSLPAFVGELREGLPSLIPAVFLKNTAGWSQSLKGRLRDAKNVGSDYLNVQFGWIPLLNDVISIASALAKATVAITAMDELHRWRELPETDVTSVSELGLRGNWTTGPSFPGTLSTLLGSSTSSGSSQLIGTTTYIQNYRSRMWFEGNFVKLPKESSRLDQHMDRFEWLIRTDLTPSDLWQIAPWSWLVDWFIDIGGLIDAFQTGTSNRILSTYAYAMREEVRTSSILIRNIRGSATDGTQTWFGPRDYSMHYVASRKRRIRANPFGFSLNPSVNLNVGQQAILAALGLTKIK